jgi:hypothetical protein
MSNRAPVPPEECPDPSVHGNPFRYCPLCSWIEEPEPKRLTVGDLTSAHLGRVVLLPDGLGDQRRLPLLSVNHRQGMTEVFWAYEDRSMASGQAVPPDTTVEVF